jgi:hypothetical protein
MNWTPRSKNKFLGPALFTVLTCVSASSAAAQIGDFSSYQGPGMTSPGVGNIGSRGGQATDLRFFGGVSGVYDSNPQSVGTDAQGNLLKTPNLYGVELNFGAYGSHNFRLSRLGLDYHGDYRHYNSSNYDSTDHALSLGFTYQASRRLVFDLREAVGSLRYGNGGVAASATSDPSASLNQSSLFVDSRTYYAQSTASLTFLQSAKTSYTITGSGFLQQRPANGLSNSWGYTMSGAANRRLSKSVTVGGLYQHSYFESPGFGSESTVNAYLGTFAAGLGRFWTLSLQGGATVAETQSPFSITLNPLLAALLGQKTLSGIAYIRNIYPSGSVELRRQFQHSSVAFLYNRSVNSGNGLTGPGRAEDFRTEIGYTGLRKISLNASGGYSSLIALGQATYKFRQFTGGGGMSYNLGHDLHVNARFDFRDQEINLSNYALRGSRTSVGLFYSPGKLPLSLW